MAVRRGALLLLVAACARVEAPPGGPPDVAPPRLVAVHPESLATVPNFGGDVVFQFNEVISEGSSPSQGTGTGDLERLVILSPTSKVPEVHWRRSRITVRPREGWAPNRVYRVQLLPGVTDLHSNRSSEGRVLTFATGGTLPAATLRGSVNDWTAGSPARGALVEAVLLPDSLVYRALADSSGRIDLGPLPRGEYIVYGVIDQNRNNRRDPREAWDSVRVTLDTVARAELWTFPHDTIGPRIQSATVVDSVTAALAFSQPLDPAQRLEPSAVEVRLLPDSTPMTVRSLLPPAVHDSTYRRAAPVSAHPVGPTDTSRTARSATTRPPLDTRLQLRVAEPFTPGAHYAIAVRGVRNANGAAADARTVLNVPARAPVDTTHRAPTDSTPGTPSDSARRAPPDSTRRTPADSARRAPPGSVRRLPPTRVPPPSPR